MGRRWLLRRCHLLLTTVDTKTLHDLKCTRIPFIPSYEALRFMQDLHKPYHNMHDDYLQRPPPLLADPGTHLWDLHLTKYGPHGGVRAYVSVTTV